MADSVLVLCPDVRSVPLRWENQVQDIGPPDQFIGYQYLSINIDIISCNIKRWKLSQRSPSQREDPAPLNDQQTPVLDTLCQTTSKTGTQFHPLAERLPKIIIRSQTPQNTTLNAVLPTRKTRSSLIHQNTGTSPLHQEAYTTHWTNFSHWGQTPKTTGTMNLQPVKRRPQTQ